MTSFVDASILVAILAQEEDWQYQSDRVDEYDALIWSPVSRWETVTGLRRQRKMHFAEARDTVSMFGEENGLRLVTIGQLEADWALNAQQTYGRTSGIPPSSTWATVLLTPAPRPTPRPCSTRAPTSSIRILPDA